MNFIYVIHLPYWNHLIAFKKLCKINNKNLNQQRAPLIVSVPAVVSVLAVSVSVSFVCDQDDHVFPAHPVDDIDEVHELDPVHQVDHKDELN